MTFAIHFATESVSSLSIGDTAILTVLLKHVEPPLLMVVILLLLLPL
jgi:hypothetical protein